MHSCFRSLYEYFFMMPNALCLEYKLSKNKINTDYIITVADINLCTKASFTGTETAVGLVCGAASFYRL